MGPSTPDAARSGGRFVWADVAKGTCIVLVVLHHLVAKHYVAVLVEPHDWLGEAWVGVTYALKPVRMPLFFLVSGIFAASALRRPWDQRQTTRLVGLYFLYSVWLVIHMGIFSAATELPMNRTSLGSELLMDLVFASTGLWYLYALAVYVPVARLLLGVGPGPAIALAVTVALVAPLLGIDAVNRVSVLQHFVFFLVGALLPTVGKRAVALGRKHTVLLVLGAVGLALLLWAEGVPLSIAKIIVSVLALPVALRAAAALAAWAPARLVLGYVGRHTLPVYVLHVPVLALAHRLLAERVLDLVGTWPGPLVGLYPVVLAVAIVAVCLLLHRLLGAIGLGWLFRPTVVEPLVTAAHRHEDDRVLFDGEPPAARSKRSGKTRGYADR